MIKIDTRVLPYRGHYKKRLKRFELTFVGRLRERFAPTVSKWPGTFPQTTAVLRSLSTSYSLTAARAGTPCTAGTASSTSASHTAWPQSRWCPAFPRRPRWSTNQRPMDSAGLRWRSHHNGLCNFHDVTRQHDKQVLPPPRDRVCGVPPVAW